jgi:hypothetical protein
MEKNSNLKEGDVLICTKTLQFKGKVDLTKEKEYIIEEIFNNSLNIRNNLGQVHWFDIKKSSKDYYGKYFKLKDKKEVRCFDSGAKRDGNSQKPFIHNLLGYTRQRFGYHMTLGANRYGDNNWLKGLPTECYLESVDRHLAAYLEGDRSEDHLSAIIFGIQGCMLNEKNEGIKSNHYFKNNDKEGTL